ncbi:23S rRNA (adenine(2503)-C(2))-methyltransferase RlmN [Defluviitalea phaphyphila]|uniref:23S rRNA (adenine(2503)-C(2))-methyltransferase RlmN n=1 Tax=Defluviitalea phaphyphila TaxID=1473580 RepID=UPI0007319C9C|nr:23S rRNA (adenine(2503)-C(2))-methyltransferase RlmN [Defluviitalea phaphyphila]
MRKIDIASLTIEELKDLMKSLGEKGFRGEQIFQWIHEKKIRNIDDMTNIPKKLREKLKNICEINTLTIEQKYVSKIDKTTKYLFALKDNNIIESVLMYYDYGNTVCISSQVGCKMGCAFCASTLGGLVRNLTVSEMTGQIYKIKEDSKEKISNIVIMGSGEPLDNLDNILSFIDIINSPKGENIGQRHITISTCGLIDKIYFLANKKLQITLAVSLHASNDEIRKKIMPIANKYSMEELFKACHYYIEKTNRRITFEYALINNVNDKKEYAHELGKKLKGMLCHVNLIPINQIKESNLKESESKTIKDFFNILKSYGISTTIRRKLGSDIDAACGQLRRRYLEKK